MMLVSRSGEELKKSVKSVLQQEPDEFRAYIDTKTIPNVDEAKVVLKDANANISDFIYPKMDHHQNIVHNYHRAILEANCEWVVKADDEDELVGDRKQILRNCVEQNCGIIHGDKIVDYGINKETQEGTQINGCNDLRFKRIYSGTVMFRKRAFQQIHSILDHGYFYDWKTWYWILRAGWNSKYIHEVLYYQNWTLPKQDRLLVYGTFPQVIDKLNAVPNELLEYSKGLKSKDWKYHLSIVE